MEFSKSLVPEILDIVTETLADLYALLQVLPTAHVRKLDMTNDVAYLRKRTDAEGLAFLTVTLPRLGEWFDQQTWGESPGIIEGFAPYDGYYPRFLRPLWLWVRQFKADAMSSDDAQVVRVTRTLLHGLKKLNVPCGDEKIQLALDSYVSIESELADFEVFPSKTLQHAQLVLETLLDGYIPTCSRPRHGPGAVAGGERHSTKWEWSHKYDSVHAEWSYWDYLYPVREVASNYGLQASPKNHRIQLAAQASNYRALLRCASPTARLIMVPKDSRGPRIINAEPKELMYLEQGVASHLMKYLESHSMTRGHVNFDDQQINANLALRSSSDKAMDTIDLKDASDRVSVQLIRFLLPERVSKKWLALRSTAVVLPNKQVLALSKFAAMGSALCFPVESLVFWAIAVGSVWKQTGDLGLALTSVYVYGDDIIIAAGYTGHVMHELEMAGLMVNRAKSFIGSHPFRESCGIEALNGHDVTPLRVKKLPPQRPSDGDGIMAYVKYAENSQYITPRRSRHLLTCAERLIGPIPRTRLPQAFVCFVTTDDVWEASRFSGVRWCPKRCALSVKVYTVKGRSYENVPVPWSRVQRNLIEDFADREPTLVVDRQSTQIRRKNSYLIV